MSQSFLPIDGWTVTRNSADSNTDLVEISVCDSSIVTEMKIRPVTYFHPIQSIVDGVIYPSMITPEKWKMLNSSVKYRASDILVVSYPKSGTTLIEQCILLILNGGNNSVLCPANKNVYSPTASEKGGKIWLEACIDQDKKVLRGGKFMHD